MNTPKLLYHYTSAYHLLRIIASERITTTTSDLLKPKHLMVVNGCAIDPETDWYRPVVWLTDSLDPKKMGLDGASVDKKRIRITIPMQPYFKKWGPWATQNNMDSKWRRAYVRDLNWKSWYVSEIPIFLDDVAEIRDLETNTIIKWQKDD